MGNKRIPDFDQATAITTDDMIAMWDQSEGKTSFILWQHFLGSLLSDVLVQEQGTQTNKAMSQKAVSDALTALSTQVALDLAQKQSLSEKDQVNGYAGLDAGGLILLSKLQALISDADSSGTDKTWSIDKIKEAIAALVDSSPGSLDTLNELAAALGDDPNFATTVTALIAAKEATANKATGTGALADSDTTYPSEKKVKSAIAKMQLILNFIDLETFVFTQAVDYKITSVDVEAGVTATIKLHGTGTDYVLGDTITAFNKLDITVDVLGAININYTSV